MILLLIPFTLSLLVLVFVIFALERKVAGPSEEVHIGAFAGKVERVAKTFFWQLFRVAIAAAILVGGVLLAIPVFFVEAAGAFVFGVFTSLAVIYYIVRLTLRLQALVLEGSERGPIQTFHTAFNGGNMLGIFVVAAVVFFVTAYYLIGNVPSALSLVSFALGSLLVTLLFKIGGSMYERTLPRASTETSSEPQNKHPEVLAVFAKHHIGGSLGVILSVMEIALLGVVGSLLAAGLVLPGVGNAAVFTFLLFAIGFVSSGVSIFLLRFGATTNIRKNVLLSFAGMTLLASILVFPALIWVLGDVIQYSILSLWLSVIVGYMVAAGIAVGVYFKDIRRIHGHLLSSSIFFLFVGFAGLSYLFSDFYGYALATGAFASFSGALVAVVIFFNLIANGKEAAVFIDLPEERRNVFEKLASTTGGGKRSAAVYFPFAVVALALLFFVLYQVELSTQSVELVFSLENADLFFGLFLGSGTVLFISYIFDNLRRRMKRSFMRETSDSTAAPHENTEYPIQQQKRWRYTRFAGILARAMTADSILFIFALFSIPLAVGILGGAEVFRGFLLGFISIGLLGIVTGIFDKQEEYTYSDTDAVIASSVRIVGLIALFLVIYFVR